MVLIAGMVKENFVLTRPSVPSGDRPLSSVKEVIPEILLIEPGLPVIGKPDFAHDVLKEPQRRNL